MNDLLKKYLKGDTVIWIVFMLLCLISAVEMFSASSSLAYKAGNHTAPVLSHITFLGMGAIVVFLVHLVPYKYFRMFNYLLMITAFVTLIITIFQGISAGGAKRWLDMGFFQFQPSELAKISVIIFIADILARKQQKDGNADEAFKPIVIVLAVFCGLIFPENFSTAFLLFAIAILMMIIGRISFKRIGQLLGAVAVIGCIAFVVGWKIPAEYLGPFDRLPTQVGRIISFSDNEDKFALNDKTRQVVNAQIAIANGGFFPKMPGTSAQRDYLPEAYSDFIYAIAIEEMGLLGGLVIIALYLILLYRAGIVTFKSTQTFPALLVIGLSLMIVVQAFISMSVATHLGPVTGQPLPLISRGGTSILITCIYFGMILSVTRSLQEENKSENVKVEEVNEE